jgi:hypothetical protein
MRKLAIAGLFLMLSAGMARAALAAESPAKSVTGSLIDTYCYGTMGAHGASHKQCAIACAKKGIPVGLLEKGTDKIYVLLPKKNAQPIPDDVIGKMEDEVTVTGHEYTSGGATFLTVDSVK